MLVSLLAAAAVLVGTRLSQASEGKAIVYIFPKRGDEMLAHFTWTGTNAEWQKAEKFVQKTVESKYGGDSFTTARIMPGHCGFLYIQTLASGQKNYFLSSAHDNRAAAQKEADEKRDNYRAWGWNYTVLDVVCAE